MLIRDLRYVALFVLTISATVLLAGCVGRHFQAGLSLTDEVILPKVQSGAIVNGLCLLAWQESEPDSIYCAVVNRSEEAIPIILYYSNYGSLPCQGNDFFVSYTGINGSIKLHPKNDYHYNEPNVIKERYYTVDLSPYALLPSLDPLDLHVHKSPQGYPFTFVISLGDSCWPKEISYEAYIYIRQIFYPPRQYHGWAGTLSAGFMKVDTTTIKREEKCYP